MFVYVVKCEGDEERVEDRGAGMGVLETFLSLES